MNNKTNLLVLCFRAVQKVQQGQVRHQILVHQSDPCRLVDPPHQYVPLGHVRLPGQVVHRCQIRLNVVKQTNKLFLREII